MDTSKPEFAKQIALAAIAFEHQRIGRAPQSVTAVLSNDILVITLHGALSVAEKALANSPQGAAQVQEFHRQLFNDASHTLRQEIRRITGVEVREAAVEIDTASGAVVKALTTGTLVQVYLLAGNVMTESWSGAGSGDHASEEGRKEI